MFSLFLQILQNFIFKLLKFSWYYPFNFSRVQVKIHYTIYKCRQYFLPPFVHLALFILFSYTHNYHYYYSRNNAVFVRFIFFCTCSFIRLTFNIFRCSNQKFYEFVKNKLYDAERFLWQIVIGDTYNNIST